MKDSLKVALLLLFILFATTVTIAQEAPKYRPTGVYSLKFVISEIENGKASNQRTYSMLIREETKAQIKTGNRIPIATGSISATTPTSTNTQFQYIDVGFNADTSISEREGHLALDMDVDIGGMTPADPNSPMPGNNPILRQVREKLYTVLVEGRPTVVTSMDDVNTKRTVQIEVTVTKVK